MFYEEEFNNLVPFQPIYSTQVRIIKRLCPTMEDERIYKLSADEANLFINSIRHKYIRSSFEWLWAGERGARRRAKGNKVQVKAFEPTKTPDISEAKQVLSLEITVEKISKKESRI